MKRSICRAWIIWPLSALLAASVISCSFNLMDLTPKSENEHSIGINLFASQLDYVEDRLFADVMKTARKWTVPGLNSYGGGSDITNLDQNGWPNTDAELVVWHGINNMNGTYYLEGESNAKPVISTGYGNAEIQNFKYSEGRFTANLIYHSTDGSGLMLRFMDTDGGIRNVRLMRPRTVGSSIPYSTATTFTDQAKKLVANFRVIRFLWSIDCWNGPCFSLIFISTLDIIVICNWPAMEKRRQERYKLDVPIKIRRYEDGLSSLLEASSKDISSAGVFIKACEIQLEPRQRVHLELTLTIRRIKELFGYSGRVSVELDGLVIRSVGSSVVVEFEDHYSISPI